MLLLIEKKFLGKILQRMPAVFAHAYTLFVVLLGWVFFYFTDAGSIFHMLRLMFGFSGQAAWNLQGGLLLRENILFFAIAFFAATPLAARLGRRLADLQHSGQRRRLITAVATGVQFLLLFVCTASLVGSTYNPFLYFRF